MKLPIDAEEIKAQITSIGYAFYKVKGSCMEPVIKNGSIVKVTSMAREPMTNDILVGTRETRLYAHRLVYIQVRNNVTFYYLKGDNSLGIDPPITKDQIIGIVVT